MTRSELSLLIDGRNAASTGRGAQMREAAGLSQAELARLVGVTSAAISRWEAGERVPSETYSIRYARALRKIAQEVALHA